MNDLVEICKYNGQVLIDGENINDTSTDPVSLRTRVGMVFQKPNPFPKSVVIDTYKDHRMAMAFACISSGIEIYIREPSVVNKSYPNFWNDLFKVGYEPT